MSGFGQAQEVYRQTKSGVLEVEALKIQIHLDLDSLKLRFLDPGGSSFEASTVPSTFVPTGDT